jgi:S1-C subfamily serine protease
MKKKFILPIITIILVLSMSACQLTSFLPTQQTTISTPTMQGSQGVTINGLSGEQDQFVSIYQNVSQGVVSIKIYDATGAELGLGSGWVYSSDGYIVTNNHVVEGAAKLEVDFTSGFKTFGTVVGTDAHADLAVIQVTAPAAELTPLKLGDSSQLKVGQIVVAIGNPFGLDSTMTTGIISALGRAMPATASTAPGGGYYSSSDIIQTDAALNPGNSGGPLLNLAGEVVGVNQAIRTSGTTSTGDPTNSGIGFAIPINIVKRVVPSLISTGSFVYPYLGISTLDVFDQMSLAEITKLGLTQFTGAYVTSITAGSPAEKAGMIASNTDPNSPDVLPGGDLIIAIDGHPVLRFDDLIGYLYSQKSPGDKVVITVLRGTKKVDLTLTLATRP